MKKLVTALIGAGLLSAAVGIAHAAVTAEEAKKLGTTLTSTGAEKAGNKEGTIPEYTGGLTTPPAGFIKGSGVRPDPFASEKPLFSIDARNMAQYANKLSEGAKALMKANPDFRIDVYKTHRSVAFPKSVLENTVKNATRAKVADDGYSIQGARAGIPFPIPKNGIEVMQNYKGRYQGLSVILPKYSAYNVDSSGKLVLSTQGTYFTEAPFYDQSKPEDPTVLTRVRANYTGPTRRAGESAMVVDALDENKGRRAWQYLPGQRRVRLAPDLAYDTPNSSTSGMATYDDTSMFNGKMDRYDWKLVGKKEMYVPYNTYEFTYAAKAEDVFQPKFINPSMVRWELHRMWVIEATLKEDKRHIYSKRTFYLDEDSWNVLAVDQYDGRGQLWRPGFSYQTQSYDVSANNNSPSGHYDLISGSYYINMWPGTSGIKYSESMRPDTFWSPDGLAGSGVR
ncbi:DUF1329 domain-containing protein [Massilia cavernae]|uniref:DUF1329 domain-containing protein n=1 Tax=Massilia cavernae TaxID=2320864 RepID=A0A418XT22_9BURK|nr:DUF1329 domain-containing protein [Massilia cavernae]RJG15606.1 DUF1329 domain-containing protein [Massilia cavernae]